MFLIIIQALFFFLPAYIANAIPIILSRFQIWEFLNIPVDLGRIYDGQPLFGKTKTYRGIISGALAGMVVSFLQILFYSYLPEIHFLYLFPYTSLHIVLLGFLLGLGEGLGDLIKSFIKRRLGITSTAPFFPFDQMSFLGALLLGFLFFIPPHEHIVVLLIFSPGLPIIANIAAYFLGWKKVWW